MSGVRFRKKALSTVPSARMWAIFPRALPSITTVPPPTYQPPLPSGTPVFTPYVLTGKAAGTDSSLGSDVFSTDAPPTKSPS